MEIENRGNKYVRNVLVDLSEALIDIFEALKRMKRTLNTFVIKITIVFSECRTDEIVFESEIPENLPANQGATKGGAKSSAYNNLSVGENVSFCTTESAFSSLKDRINVLCAEYKILVSGQPTKNAKENQYLRDKEKIVWFNIKKKRHIPYTHNNPRY